MSEQRISYAEISRCLHARLQGAGYFAGAVCTDTRRLQPGDLFVALKGPRFDGHEFVPTALAGGAAALLTERDMQTEVPQLLVPDTLKALGELALLWRKQFELPLIAVTGSNGKTTVKEMIAAILNLCGATLATEGNLNNNIGVPLTLLKLRPQHRYAVIEMGANHAGEIHYLCRLALPCVAVITNAAAAHLEGFGSIEGVAKAKAEIYGGLGKRDTAIVNFDDAYTQLWRAGTQHCRQLGFSLERDQTAQIYGERHGETLHVRTPAGEFNLRLPLPGEHNARNVLAATAAACALEIAPATICRALQTVKAVQGRLQVHHSESGITVLDDTYNANPGSLRAALETLVAMPGEPWLVLGDMGELGKDSARLHAEMGALASQCKVRYLYALGDLAAHAAHAFGEDAYCCRDYREVLALLQSHMHAGINILVKGSRAMRMERVVAELLTRTGGGNNVT